MTREVFIKDVKRFLLTHCLTSLFITVSLGFLVWRWVDFAYGQTTCPVGVTRHAPHEITHETCPAIAKTKVLIFGMQNLIKSAQKFTVSTMN
jgi:hypothetical protein